jgi:hypothetical protein
MIKDVTTAFGGLQNVAYDPRFEQGWIIIVAFLM